MQARLVKRERSYMVGIAVSVPSEQSQLIKLNKAIMKQLVSLQRYLSLQGTEEVIALSAPNQQADSDQQWVIGYPVPHRFPVHKEFSLCELPSGTYFVGEKGAKIELTYKTMRHHWIMAEMYDSLSTIFERYTITGDDKRVEVFSRVKPKIVDQQIYA
ncbi:GyrI-like domain-containing protein [Chryseomicrobium sp. FSL W7-1435]|uniref:GyrI-like domain-containing protein n=1 Tax=Chryseomicrobium sp. FSL W7-1435 TaxID=2921704 RepID=UPI00315A11CB